MHYKRFIVCLVLVASTIHNKAQQINQVVVPQKKLVFEAGLFPGLILNTASIGFSKETNFQSEHAVTLGFLASPYAVFSSVIRYNYNIGLKKRNQLTTYYPLWTSLRYILHAGNGEEGSSGNESHVAYSAGIGFGGKYTFKSNHQLRVETGIGLTYLTSIDSKSNDQFKANTNYPYLPAFRFNVKYLIPLSR